jgi:uncharacterized protein
MNAEVSPADITVTGLFSYPVKSCRAVSHVSVMIDKTGLSHDREWMLVDTRHTPARFITQRECPRLAAIAVQVNAAGDLILSHDDLVSTTVIVRPTSSQQLIRVKVWSSEVFGLRAGDHAAEWFSAVTGIAASHLALVCFERAHKRVCNTRYAGESGAHTLFADGYPMLIANQASLDDLNRRMGRSEENALPMNRFRPNVVISGLEAWDEDHVDRITINDVVLKLVKPCVRCEITTTDQTSGGRISDEPLNTLARFRNNPDFGGVTFGWNAIVMTAGSLSIGDPAAIEYRF